jgi:hypothetical protein
MKFEEESMFAERPWTVLVYMVADHKHGGTLLDPFADKELRAIVNAANLTDMHVAVQVDFTMRPGTFRGAVIPDGSGAAVPIDCSESGLHEAEPDRKFVEGNKSITFCRGRETNAADPNVLKRFLAWGKRVCPAKRYAIMFWGHSFGPMGLFLDGHRPRADRVEDGTAGLERVAGAVEGGLQQPANVVLFKDCLMSTFETAYQMRGVAKYAIGSQGLIPIKGVWPYTDLFAILQTATLGNEFFVARALAARLGTYYDDALNRAGFAEVPMSLLDLGVVPNTLKPIKTLVDAIQQLDTRKARPVRKAFERARAGRAVEDLRHPGDPALLDVATLCRHLLELDTGAKQAVQELEGTLVTLVPWTHSQRTIFNGISIYYTLLQPDALARSAVQVAVFDEPNAYKKLALNAETEWSAIALEQF